MKKIQNVVSTFSMRQKHCCHPSLADLEALACPFWHHVTDSIQELYLMIMSHVACARACILICYSKSTKELKGNKQ